MLTYTRTTSSDWDKLGCQEARRCTEQSQRKQMEERDRGKKQIHATTHLHITRAHLLYGLMAAQLVLDRRPYLSVLTLFSPLCLYSSHVAALQSLCFCVYFTKSAKTQMHHLSAIFPTATNKPYGSCDSRRSTYMLACN